MKDIGIRYIVVIALLQLTEKDEVRNPGIQINSALNMNDILKYNKIHLFAGMGLILFLFHFNIYQKKIIDLDEVVYLHLAEHMGWDWSEYNTIKLFPPGYYPRAVYSSPVFHHPPLYPYSIKLLASTGISGITAARTLNIMFMLFGIVYLYLLAELLCNRKVALLSSFLLMICPIFMMETNLIHLDQYQSFFLIVLLYYFFYSEKKAEKKHLFISAFFFALAMLVKFTSPIFFLFPAILAVKRFIEKQDRKQTLIFILISSLGFMWWLYIICRFHSLLPVEIIGNGATILVKPDKYLIEITKRQWWQVWALSAVICPLFIFFYIPGVIFLFKKGIELFLKRHVQKDLINLILINTASILSILAFSLGNAVAKGHWALRYFLPIYPFVYLIASWGVIQILKKNQPILNSWTLTAVLISCILMLFTDWNVILYQGLIIKPSLFILFQNLEKIIL